MVLKCMILPQVHALKTGNSSDINSITMVASSWKDNIKIEKNKSKLNTSMLIGCERLKESSIFAEEVMVLYAFTQC